MLLLQHRTVWVVTTLVGVYVLTRERALTRQALVGMVAGVVVFSALSFTVFDAGDGPIGDQLASSATETGTFEWRVAGWAALIDASGPEGPTEQLLGAPFGGGWERVLDGNVVDVSPHNMYLETYLRTGAIGLLLLLGLYAVTLRRLVREPPPAALTGYWGSGHILGGLLVGQMIYYVTYTPNAAQALLLGLACAVAGERVGEARASREQQLEVR